MSRLVEIEAFVAVAEQGSFVAAGKLLGVSSSYASKLVSRLEERLGVRLIQRTTRKHTLTPQGERYLLDCQEAFGLLRRSEECIHEATSAIRGDIRLTAPTGLGLGVLAEVLNAFAKAHPEVRLNVVYLDRVVDLVGERFDFAIRVGILPDSSLRARRIGSYRRKIIADPSTADALSHATHPTDLRGLPAAVYSGHTRPGEWTLRRGNESATAVLEGRVESNNGRALALAAADGLGLAYLPGFHTCDLEASGRLVSVLPEWGEDVPVHVVFPTNRHLPSRVRALMDHIIAALSHRG